MFWSKKEIITICPNCSSSKRWNGNRCLRCGYIHTIAQKDTKSAECIQCLFRPEFYHPLDVFVGTKKVPRRPGLYGWYFDKSIVDKIVANDTYQHLIKAIRPEPWVDKWFLLYIGIAGKSKDRTLQDRIHGEHLNQNTKGSTLRQTLSALLWKEINLDPRLQLNTLDEKNKLNLWIYDHAMITWLDVERPEKLEDILLKEYGEYLPFNLQGNKANPYLKELKQLRQAWRKGK